MLAKLILSSYIRTSKSFLLWILTYS